MSNLTFSKALNILSKYVRAYGLPGMGTLARHYFQMTHRARGALINFEIPSSNRKVHLRAGSSDWKVFTQVFLDDEYGVDTMWLHSSLRARYERILAEGKLPVIVDAGANIGLSSIRLSSIFPQAHLIALEPDVDNWRLAEKNCAGLPVTVINAGVWSRHTRVAVRDSGVAEWAYRFEETSDAEQGVQAITVDDALERVPGGALLLVKMDIEGAESSVLAADAAWIQTGTPLIVESHDRLTGGGCLSGLLKHSIYTDGRIDIKGENYFFVPRVD